MCLYFTLFLFHEIMHPSCSLFFDIFLKMKCNEKENFFFRFHFKVLEKKHKAKDRQREFCIVDTGTFSGRPMPMLQVIIVNHALQSATSKRKTMNLKLYHKTKCAHKISITYNGYISIAKYLL